MNRYLAFCLFFSSNMEICELTRIFVQVVMLVELFVFVHKQVPIGTHLLEQVDYIFDVRRECVGSIHLKLCSPIHARAKV